MAFVDARGRLWTIWPAIVDNNWESAILRYRVATTAGWAVGAPPWNDGGIILLRPDTLQQKLEPFAKSVLDSGLLPAADRAEVARFMGRLSDKLYNRLGWMPRAHVLRLPSGRLLLPLYSDTYNVGLVAVSDDGGASWRAGDPIVSLGGVQPSLVRRRDGTIIAFMRDNGPPPQLTRDPVRAWCRSRLRDPDIHGILGIPSTGDDISCMEGSLFWRNQRHRQYP